MKGNRRLEGRIHHVTEAEEVVEGHIQHFIEVCIVKSQLNMNRLPRILFILGRFLPEYRLLGRRLTGDVLCRCCLAFSDRSFFLPAGFIFFRSCRRFFLGDLDAEKRVLSL